MPTVCAQHTPGGWLSNLAVKAEKLPGRARHLEVELYNFVDHLLSDILLRKGLEIVCQRLGDRDFLETVTVRSRYFVCDEEGKRGGRRGCA